ncbi:GTP-binding protein [Paenibacillus doosanensis]|uniref:CobW family GTP-binding protein n=1 Tax=Paenibacillus doosanensis TaxID=1229154 RepID=UPI00217F8CBF|nr:GTP-binding protein [Paenibacillus doosanensis]MCS7464687.1 GTP-binding protein [Paenibacillus doosanensis]
MKRAVPVHILSGFLGSGKTTLLSQAIDYYKLSGRKPAVLMNELGDVNLDGMLVEDGVPMTEMLSGCICCTIRGDLGLELRDLIRDNDPDVIFVECTGAANPIEILEGVTDASLLTELELKSVITVIDAAHLLAQKNGKGKTFRLMQDQVRCATQLILNKIDLIEPGRLAELESEIRELNPAAPMTATVRCQVDMAMFDAIERSAGTAEVPSRAGGAERHDCGHEHGEACSHPSHEHDHEHGHEVHSHHSHDHVMVYTHYFSGPIDSEAFEELVGRLPEEVYRAKGILRFSDTASLFLFQYAYREMDFVKIAPKEAVPNVAVFIGEHFSKDRLAAELKALEQKD